MLKMRKMANSSLNYDNYGAIINHHIEPLKADRLKNNKKIIEICHVGKFLLVLGENYGINKVREKPDFLISINDQIIGLEHQVIVDGKSREREGFFEGLFDQAELKLQQDEDLPNFLANCYLKPYVNFKINEKSHLIDVIYFVVKEYVLNDHLIENPLIERIMKMGHSQINVNVNLGAWWQKNLTIELLTSAIKSKENKLDLYKNNTVSTQWLLLVVGGTGESSFEVEGLDIDEIESKFDKVYLMEDLKANVYEVL